jgi:hypothetical protein
VAHQVHESFNQLCISFIFVGSTSRAHVDFEFETMKRMFPRSHLWIDETIRSPHSETSDVYVMIDQLARIYVVEGAVHQVGRFGTEFIVQLFRLSFEGAADGMNETH